MVVLPALPSPVSTGQRVAVLSWLLQGQKEFLCGLEQTGSEIVRRHLFDYAIKRPNEKTLGTV